MEATNNVVPIKNKQLSPVEESLRQIVRDIIKEEYPAIVTALKMDLAPDPSQPDTEFKTQLLAHIRRDKDVHDALTENFAEHIEEKVHDEVGENVGEIVDEKIGEYDFRDMLQEEVYSKLSLKVNHIEVEPEWD